MKYKVYEIDPEFDQSKNLYVGMVRDSGYYGGEGKTKKWVISVVTFSQREYEEYLEEDTKMRLERSAKHYDSFLPLLDEDRAVLRIKLPDNVLSKRNIGFYRTPLN
jgi:hypothetical protein